MKFLETDEGGRHADVWKIGSGWREASRIEFLETDEGGMSKFYLDVIDKTNFTNPNHF